MDGQFGVLQWAESGLALAAGAEKQHVINVPGEAYYHIHQITGQGIDSSKNELNIGVKIRDQGNGYDVADSFIRLSLVAGNGQNPYPIPQAPWVLKPNSNVTVTIKNLEASTALDRIDIILLGERILA